MTMDYDVRIDTQGDTWVVHTLPNGGKVEVNKTRLDAYQARASTVLIDEAMQYGTHWEHSMAHTWQAPAPQGHISISHLMP